MPPRPTRASDILQKRRAQVEKSYYYFIIRSVTNRRENLICYECKIINLFTLCIELLEVNVCELAKLPE